jgi:hypothetical protein
MRLRWAVPILLATVAASPTRSLPIPHTPPAHAKSVVAANKHSPLPVPPMPPAHPPMDQLAPVPDLYAKAPVGDAAGGAQVTISDFRVRRLDQSLGYTPGSHFRNSEDRRVIQTPGLSVRVPIQ